MSARAMPSDPSSFALLALAAIGLWGCGNTPIDAIVAERVTVDGGLGDSGLTGDAATCTSTRAIPGAGRFRIFSASSGQCLGLGPPTTVLGLPAFSTQTSSDCSGEGQLWDIEETMFPGSFRLRNVGLGLYLDIERGQDANGTRAILFDMNDLFNQVFSFRPRTNDEYEIAPNSAVGSCLTEFPSGIQIWTCSPGNFRQQWATFQTSCP